MYFVAFGLVIMGLTIYHSEKAPLQVGQEEGDMPKRPRLLQFFTVATKTSLVSSRLSGADNNISSNTFDYNPLFDQSVDRSRLEA